MSSPEPVPTDALDERSGGVDPGVLEALRAITGIRSVRVQDPAGTLRLELAPEAGPSSLVARSREVLAQHYGGHRVGPVRLVERTGPLNVPDGPLVVDSLTLESTPPPPGGGDPGGTQVDVELSWGSRRAPAHAEEVGHDDDAQARAVAAAVLLALEEVTEDAVIATVEAFGSSDDGEQVTVRLRLDIDGEEVTASGAAPHLGHRPQAVVRALLAGLTPHLPD